MADMTNHELERKLRDIACSSGGFTPSELPDPQRPAIYLTFDDGPGPYTETLLDILKGCGVRATFFVTAKAPEYLDCVTRAFAEGHSVGVHSFSHDYGKIYAGTEAFLRDFLACEDIIRARTGSYTPLFRFPGGSSNTVSRVTPGIMTRLSKTLPALGFHYFDWNVDSGDTAGIVSKERIFSNIIEGCRKRQACVVLQHDINGESVGILRDVIAWGRANGYCFLPLGPDSPAAKHNIAN